MTEEEKQRLREKQAYQARERRRNQTVALTEARRSHGNDSEAEIERRARLIGARWDPPQESESIHEQRNR